ncbi:zinc ribbon domain-containing protein [Candidatus Bathycorpusculum sp.]|uniref:zinc ribbon domain-containing protein n=1 Tax=Candidatus Bathycorpusculum sp. TaxID=2994959 RepID=UPI0028280470|nr:zinc ribbon domain-containing protein [Candidatus Termitimicrobium sp.]MCL2431983.1 zinc ribbon domain-containing protein [Candidatus Termitimicrobium sp.]
MVYCRRCGAQLEENACFCHKCGTQVIIIYAPSTTLKPNRKNHVLLMAVGLMIILVLSATIAVFLAVPSGYWSFSKPYQDSAPNVCTLNLNFETDIGEVNIISQKVGGNNLLLDVSGSGSGPSLEERPPVNVAFNNQTRGDVLDVSVKVTLEDTYLPMAHLDCTIYVDPVLNLNLNVTSHNGKVSFLANQTTTIQSLRLQTINGEVNTHLGKDIVITGDIALKTSVGTVNYCMNETLITANCTLTLAATTGEINIDITQTRASQGNLLVDTETTTGAINIGLVIDGSIAAKVTSELPNTLGDINLHLNNFIGAKTQVQSINYPATGNIEISNRVNSIGNINISANYRTNIIAN